MTMKFDFSRAMPCVEPVLSPDETAPIRVFSSDNAPVSRSFSRTLVVRYALDEPGARVFVRDRDLAGGASDTLHGHAVQNLRTHVERRKLRFERRGTLHVARLDGLYEASLLLLDELWDPPTRVADFPGDLVAAVPSRTGVVLTGTEAPGGVKDLQDHVEGGTFCSEVFVRRGGHWHPLGA
jgi:hypothetical protein